MKTYSRNNQVYCFQTKLLQTKEKDPTMLEWRPSQTFIQRRWGGVISPTTILVTLPDNKLTHTEFLP